MENISDINTVQDLIKANEKGSPSEEILKQVFEMGPQEGKDIAIGIIEQLAIWHDNVSEEEFKERNETSLLWARDAAILETALQMIKNVQL